LLALGLGSLAAGIWGGLARLPLSLPLPSDNANWITFHGPLMVCGFLGTVIGLERAVGLPNRWAYAAPLMTGSGALLLVSGVQGRMGPLLLTLGSALFCVVALRVVQLARALFTVVMCVGAVAWLMGNIFWWFEWPFHRVVPCWMAFLCLTIVGERLDLSRFQKVEPLAKPLFAVALSFFLFGVILNSFFPAAGGRVTGAGLLALALWLGRFDIARRTVRQAGLPRFMAVCLLGGYGWLAVAGGLMILFAPMEYGVYYDAALHTFFLGFVFAMIFGHAPVIFPSVLNLPVAYRPRFYAHVILLHGSLILRVAGDLGEWVPGRLWGGMLNGLAIAVFLGNTILSLVMPRTGARSEAANTG